MLAAVLATVLPQKSNTSARNCLGHCKFCYVFQISSLLADKAHVKQYKTLLEGLEYEKKQLEMKVGEMQKTVAQSQVNANSDGKSDSKSFVLLLCCTYIGRSKRSL
jgi:hypothetical protein